MMDTIPVVDRGTVLNHALLFDDPSLDPEWDVYEADCEAYEARCDALDKASSFVLPEPERDYWGYWEGYKPIGRRFLKRQAAHFRRQKAKAILKEVA